MDKSEVRQLIGIKYKPKGRDLNGLDCVGLVLLFHPELKIYDVYDYEDDGYHENILYELLKNLKEKEKPDKFGDILVFDFYNNGILHLGIYVENNRFIHVIKSSGVTCPRLDKRYKKSLAGVYYV